MEQKIEILKPIIFKHKVESAFLGISLIIFIVSLIMFAQLNVDSSNKTTVLIQKSKTNFSNEMVDVGGAVKRPGVYSIMPGQRVYELVDKAGGLTDEADLTFFDKSINRAQKLNDQVKIYIPFKTKQQLLKPLDTNSSSLVSINNSNVAELESLPGVGEVTAKKIIDSRPFGNIEELLKRKIVKTNTYEEIKSLITL